MRLSLGDSYLISDIARGDEAAYVEHFKEKQIYDQTLNIPYPYTPADADQWVRLNIEDTKAQGRSVNWAIRRVDTGALIGGIGFFGHKIGRSHKAELGYFLGKPYWNKGIVSEAVAKVVDYGFRELGLSRITAGIFHFNVGSARVLEKAGFRCEGYFRAHYDKNGHLHDGKLYALLKDDAREVRPMPAGSSPGDRPEFIKNYLDIQDPDNSHYPGSEEFLSIGSPFAKKFGLTRLGIHHEVLPPGRRTSWPHAESLEEEFVYVIEGCPDAWIDGRLYSLRPGDAVGFPAGTGICHTFINNTEFDARLLVVGEATRKDNRCFYALHPERNEQAKREGWFWENPPRAPQGPHDGEPRGKR